MRILYDAKALERPGGGIYEYAVQLISAISEKDNAELFVQIEPQRLPKILEGKVTPLGNYRFRGWRGLGLEGLHAEWLCRRHGIDLYHSLYYTPKPKTRVPGVATCYDFIWERYPEQFKAARKGVPRLKARTLKWADRLLCISDATRRDCDSFLGRSSGCETVYLGMDCRFENSGNTSGGEIRKRLGLERPYWLFTGPRYGYKNFARLFEAFDLEGLADRFDLVCLGHHAALTPHECEGWAKGLTEPPPYVRLLGFVSPEDRIALLRQAFALAYPSEYEGFGIPVLEAMAAGVPVVCGNRSSLPEVGGNAVEYVDPLKVEDISRGLKTVADLSDAERSARIKAGQDQATKFSWERCAEETFSVYQELMESRMD